MPRKKGQETWRRIKENADKIPMLLVGGDGELYESPAFGKFQKVDILRVVNGLSEARAALNALAEELRAKGKAPKQKEGPEDAG
jgi:hypothetical protein